MSSPKVPFNTKTFVIMLVSGLVLGMCQIVKGNSHEQRSAECVGFGKAISNVTLEPKP